MSKYFKLGDVVTLRDSGETGIVTKVTLDNQPAEITIGNRIIKIIDQIVDKAPIIIQIWYLIKSLFRF